MLRHLLLFSAFICYSFISQASSEQIKALTPAAEHALTNRAVVHHLYQHHYSRKHLNDEFSEKVYTRYLDILEALNQVRARSRRRDFREIDELAYQAAQRKPI